MANHYVTEADGAVDRNRLHHTRFERLLFVNISPRTPWYKKLALYVVRFLLWIVRALADTVADDLPAYRQLPVVMLFALGCIVPIVATIIFYHMIPGIMLWQCIVYFVASYLVLGLFYELYMTTWD